MKNNLRLNHFNKYLLALIVFVQANLSAQPVIQWDKTIGSPLNTVRFDLSKNKVIEQTADGGYILTQLSNSGISGDKTQSSRGDTDYWIVKVSANGTKQWDKTIGGPGADNNPSIHQTSDGGYIIGGTSNSSKGGEKSENNRGSGDYWVVKLDKNGSKVWDKTIGSTKDDDLVDVRQTADGSYILGGRSNGGVGGDKTGPALGMGDYRSNVDYWVVKLSATGSIVWDKTLGTSEFSDMMHCMTLTSDGGIVFAGGDHYHEYGDSGYKLMKMTADGTIAWEKTVQGTDFAEINDIEQTPDNGFILGGTSHQRAGGDQTEDSAYDYWIVKLNADLSIAWSNVLNTLFFQDMKEGNTFADLAQTPDGGYALLGTSDARALGDKSENSHDGIRDFWLVKLNASGTQVWDKVIGGANTENANSIISTSDGGLMIAGFSYSNTSYEKTENKKGEADFWVVKLAPENPPLTQTTIRINAGGPDFTTATKKLFIADNYYDEPGRVSAVASGDILNTSNDVLYRSARCSPSFSYSIPVVNAEVNVILHFAETYFGVPGTRGEKGGAGSRQFHVNIEGSRKLTNYDIFAAAGGAMRANQITIPVTVTDGVLNLVFLTGAADLPKVCAIEVLPAQVQTLTFTPEADATVRNGIYKDQNFGSDPLLGVKGGNGNLNRKTYLRFRVPDVSIVKSAKLRVYGYNHESASGAPIGTGGVFNDAWTESGITFSNAPGHQNPALESRTSVRGELKYYDMDVTDFVRSQVADDKVVSLAVVTAYNNNLIYIHSKENPSGFAPQLVIETTTTINTAARLSVENEEASENNTAPGSIIFPNPAKDHIMLEVYSGHKSEVDLELTNMAGSQFQLQRPETEGSASRLKVGLPGQLPAGMYLLKVHSKEFSEVLKVLVTE